MEDGPTVYQDDPANDEEAMSMLLRTSEERVRSLSSLEEFEKPRSRRWKIFYCTGVAICLSVFLLLMLNKFIFQKAPPFKRCWLYPSSHACDPTNNWYDVDSGPDAVANDPDRLHEIPQYVLDYAPLVHLFPEEPFWPCDMAEHLLHITPELNYTPIEDRLPAPNLTNLDMFNFYEKGRNVFLTSNDNVEDRPDWLAGDKNIPRANDNDTAPTSTSQSIIRMAQAALLKNRKGGRSDAPAVLVVLNKGHGVVDAFWFYFYSYNLGNVVLNVRFGNHVGDWEHTLVRFQHGKPKAVFVSEHNFGSAYSYGAVEKIGKRVSRVNAASSNLMLI